MAVQNNGGGKWTITAAGATVTLLNVPDNVEVVEVALPDITTLSSGKSVSWITNYVLKKGGQVGNKLDRDYTLQLDPPPAGKTYVVYYENKETHGKSFLNMPSRAGANGKVELNLPWMDPAVGIT
jgi:hypothetical protein